MMEMSAVRLDISLDIWVGNVAGYASNFRIGLRSMLLGRGRYRRGVVALYRVSI